MKNFFNIGQKLLNDTLIQGTVGGGDNKEAYVPAYPDSPGMYANDTTPEGEAEIMLDKKPYDQVAADKRYRAAQKSKGIVRKTIRVPADRW